MAKNTEKWKNRVPESFHIDRFVNGKYLGNNVSGEYRIFRFVADYKFSITEVDMDNLLERGFVRMQVNELGTVDLYFV